MVHFWIVWSQEKHNSGAFNLSSLQLKVLLLTFFLCPEYEMLLSFDSLRQGGNGVHQQWLSKMINIRWIKDIEWNITGVLLWGEVKLLITPCSLTLLCIIEQYFPENKEEFVIAGHPEFLFYIRTEILNWCEFIKLQAAECHQTHRGSTCLAERSLALLSLLTILKGRDLPLQESRYEE